MQAELTGGSRVASGVDKDVALPVHGTSDATTANQQRGGISFPGDWLNGQGRGPIRHQEPARSQ
jgi:hypothetical protein